MFFFVILCTFRFRFNFLVLFLLELSVFNAYHRITMKTPQEYMYGQLPQNGGGNRPPQLSWSRLWPTDQPSTLLCSLVTFASDIFNLSLLSFAVSLIFSFQSYHMNCRRIFRIWTLYLCNRMRIIYTERVSRHNENHDVSVLSSYLQIYREEITNAIK